MLSEYLSNHSAWKAQQLEKEKSEPLLYDVRTSLFPIKYQPIWDMYKKHAASIWFNEEIDFSKDKSDWERLSNDERFYIKKGIAFFANSDFIVNESGDKDALEAAPFEYKFFIDDKKSRENIHSETYALLLEQYAENSNEKLELQNAVLTDKTIARKAEWFRNFVQSGTFVERVIAEAIMERIFFSGTFASIFWLKKRGIMPSLCDTNEFISRDEGVHADFNVMIYQNYIVNKLHPDIIKHMVKTATDIEKEFVLSSLPVKLIGMNSELMCEYIEYISDSLLVGLLKSPSESAAEMKRHKLFNRENPFDWMALIGMNIHTDFFGHRVTSYGKSAVATNVKEELVLSDDF